jgi:hypothetical protein
MSLRTIADYGNLVALDNGKIRVVIVINLHVVSR